MSAENEPAPGDLPWRFAIDRYARARVPDLCLQLQSRFGADVCIALFCLWHAQHGSRLAPEALSAIVDGEAGRWHREVVRPLRAARMAMKVPPAGLSAGAVAQERERVKAVELAAERLELALLALSVSTGGGQDDASAAVKRRMAMGNLESYLGLLDGTAGDPLAAECSSRLVALCID